MTARAHVCALLVLTACAGRQSRDAVAASTFREERKCAEDARVHAIELRHADGFAVDDALLVEGCGAISFYECSSVSHQEVGANRTLYESSRVICSNVDAEVDGGKLVPAARR